MVHFGRSEQIVKSYDESILLLVHVLSYINSTWNHLQKWVYFGLPEMISKLLSLA